MQTQIHQTSKKNKGIVPFYSPPCRFYGQTSADIIKEARDAIMATSPIGIKPVFTSRPFTPNQKERTLFGNVKKSKSRPPSSFSLKQLKSQEPSSPVKLPSLDVVLKRKNYSTFLCSKNLSLDNLTEDYDAEVFEEFISVDQEKLPNWKKSHSCPKEGRLIKVASLNNICHSNADIKRKKEEYFKSHKKGNCEVNLRNNLTATRPFQDSIKWERDLMHSGNCQKNPEMIKGGGDYEVFGSPIEEFKIGEKHQETKKDPLWPVDEMCIQPEQRSSNQSIDRIGKEKSEINEISDSNEEKFSIQQEPVKKLQHLEEIVETAKEPEDTLENKQQYANENFAEKSVATGCKSEYLTSLKTGYKNNEIVKQSDHVPLEILELYETVRYYEADIDQNRSKTSIAEANSNISESQKALDKANSVREMKENLANVNKTEKNEVTDKFKNAVATEDQTKAISSENIEYVMNNKKRFHVVNERTDTKEKAYKKWNNQQEAKSVAPQPNAANGNWDLFWKNSYYRDQNEKEKRNEKEGDRESLQRLVCRIAGLVKKGAGNREIYEATSQLYGVIKNNKIILDSKLKEGISRALYLYIDNENIEVLLSLAKIFFLLKEENCLSVACKIIFKIARFDTNDHLFLNDEDVLELFLEGIGRASPLDYAESCIYSYGALKFLTLNHSILSRILHMGALDLMTLHLKMINNAYVENGNVGEQTQHALFQLTGALRHVAAGEGALPLFLTTNCITIVCNTLRYFYNDEDVTINISRTLSLLSTDEIVTQALMQVDNILTTLVDLMDRYKENDKILIRLAFCLGNIVEHSDLARVQLSRSDATLTVLLNVLKLYIDKDLEMSLKEGDSSNPGELSSEVIDDVIVKVIRIIANMSMNPIVGSNLSPTAKEKKSLQLSKLLSVLLMRKDPGITLLATLGCLNNISYYCNTHSSLIDITQGVERVLELESVECQIEAARVLGNLTRHKEIRDLIYSTKGDDLLIKLLLSPDREVVRCACGALVNMMLDSETRNSFVKAQGIDKLVSAIELFPGDWSLASLAARAIWNSCGDDVPSAMLHNNVEHLLNVLASSLEEENWNDGDIAWEEFASVATDLLEKISCHLDST